MQNKHQRQGFKRQGTLFGSNAGILLEDDETMKNDKTTNGIAEKWNENVGRTRYGITPSGVAYL